MKQTSKFFQQAILIILVLALAACGTNAAPTTAPSINTAAPTIVPNATTSAAIVEVPTSKLKLNLNEATREEFLTVPNVGSQMVREFLEYRPYASIQQFRKELSKYIKTEQITEYEKYVYVPVNVNKADAETLKQLPGVTDAIAADLIAGRTYASNDAFLAKLAPRISAADLAIAKNYLSK